jgi:nitroreductase
MQDMSLSETIHSARALRHFKPDQVPDAVLAKLIDAGVRAPTGSNLQNWRFVIVTDPDLRRQLAHLYRDSMGIAQNALSYRKRPAHMTEKAQQRMFASARHLAEHFAEVPVLLTAWLHLPQDQENPNLSAEDARTYVRLSGASIYGAVQNIILTCRAFGLGTVLTTVMAYKEAEAREVLSVPADMRLFAVLPIGYPAEGHGHGRVVRLPVEQVMFRDRFGNSWPTTS